MRHTCSYMCKCVCVLCASSVTLVQVSVSGLHCRMSLTMVALPFSTAQYSAVLLSCTHTHTDTTHDTRKSTHTQISAHTRKRNTQTHLSPDVDVGVLVQQSSNDLHVAPPHCPD